MFLFLGLNARPTHFAWVSFLILVVTCGYSIFIFNRAEDERTLFYKSDEVKSAIHLRVELAKLYCSIGRVTEADCLNLQTYAKAPILFENQTLKNVYLKQTRENRSYQNYAFDLTLFFTQLESESPLESKGNPVSDQYALKWNEFLKTRSNLRVRFEDILKRNHVLTRISMSPKSLIEASFLHAGWMHLVGNMLFFIVFSIFVESRIGGVTTAIIYFTAGSLGMYLQSRFFSEPTIPLIGASGCVSAIMGAALALFWRQKVRLWVNLIFYNRVFLVPAIVALPFLTVAGDLIGATDSLSNVGHVAHLTGFFGGFVMAKVFDLIDPVPQHFLYREEADLFHSFQKSNDVKAKLAALKRMLNLNPENAFVIEHASLWAIAKLATKPQDLVGNRTFLSGLLGEHTAGKLREETPDVVIQFLSSLPDDLNYKAVFKYVPLQIQLEVHEMWFENKRYKLLLKENLNLEKSRPKRVCVEHWERLVDMIERDVSSIDETSFDEFTEYLDKVKKINPQHLYLRKIERIIVDQQEKTNAIAA